MADSNVAITAGSGTNVDTRTNTANEHRQVVVIGEGAATSDLVASFRPDGVLRMAIDPSSLLLDTFETLNTVDTWTTGGTVVPTGSAGNLTVSAGTAASAQSSIRSQAAFTNGAAAFLNYVSAWQLEAGAVTGNKRVWGLGIPLGTPTVSIPITNGVVFEIQDTDGALIGAVYSNSVRTQTVALTRPTDGATHRYAIFHRSSRVYFELDGVVVGSIALPNTQVTALPACAVSVNAAAGAPATTATLIASVVGVGDTGRNSAAISDGTFAWREARVTRAGELLTTDSDRVKQSVAIAHSGRLTVGAAADAANVGRLYLINPVGSTILMEVRRVEFQSAPTAATAFPSAPRITCDRFTFTGTASGATITPAQRDSTEVALVGSLRTAITGMTVTLGAISYGFTIGPIMTAVGAAVPTMEEWQPPENGRIVLRAGQGICIRQPDAGTTADTRIFMVNLAWAEYTVMT